MRLPSCLIQNGVVSYDLLNQVKFEKKLSKSRSNKKEQDGMNASDYKRIKIRIFLGMIFTSKLINSFFHSMQVAIAWASKLKQTRL